jgi:hypothetical protein
LQDDMGNCRCMTPTQELDVPPTEVGDGATRLMMLI